MNYSRKKFLKNSLAAGFLMTSPSLLLPLAGENTSALQDILVRFSSAKDEKERVLVLEQYLKLNISDEDKEILKQVLNVADHWAYGFEKYARPGSEGNESDGYLCGFFNGKCTIDRSILPRIPEAHKLIPLIAFYPSRMLVAMIIQSGNIINVPVVRDKYLSESKRLMSIASEAFAGNELAKNYLGTFKPWEEIVPFNDRAPAWANYQRMVLEKLYWMIHWWIDNRQISDGQFGGGWGDDVEMWRSWVPVLHSMMKKPKKARKNCLRGIMDYPA